MIVSRETPPSPWKELLKTVLVSDYYNQLFSSKTPTTISRLTDGALSLFVSVRVEIEKKKLLIVSDDDFAGESLFLHLSDLIPGRVQFAPPQIEDDVLSGLFQSEKKKNFHAAYNAVCTGDAFVVIVSKSSLVEKVRPLNVSTGKGVLLKKTTTASIKKISDTLTVWGYELVDKTVVPKTFSIRGGILDIYPQYTKFPIRAEFFGNKIDSLRHFNPASQLSISEIQNIDILPPPGFSFVEKVPFSEVLACSGFLEKVYIEQTINGFRVSNAKNIKTTSVISSDIKPYSKLLKPTKPRKFLFAAEENLTKKLKKDFSGYLIIQKPFRNGFFSKAMNIDICGYLDINLQCPRKKNHVDLLSEKPVSVDLAEIEWGDYIVHEDYGIGVYRGLVQVGQKNAREECIQIDYADGGSVKVSLGRFNKIHRYLSGGGGKVVLSSLGSGKWKQQKKVVEKSLSTVVDELVKLYSLRQQSRGFVYSEDMELVNMLARSFPYIETPDQLAAIEDIMSDTRQNIPMDRLIFGDVGFGKTEVALRAAMKTISSGKQVFFLAPTTFLADQHFITSKNRLEQFGVRVDLLSRFQTKSEQQIILQKILNHNVDLLIGTHRLLSPDVTTKNLGLLVVDEEHRFGVKHKEKIKLIKSNIDVLTLTATPIPRTLQQSLVGVRDVSSLKTPPLERLPVRTVVQTFSWNSIKKQLKRELDRKGQVYFLHNDIQSIPFVVDRLKSLFPHNTVVGAHGSLPSNVLEKIVLAFFNGNIDVLVCTTIIESGLDITNANTIFINNSHRFGLAQLYQIRGRVGRGNVQAYCWLLVPSKTTLKENAIQRLKTIEHYSALGSGYNIALKDLEIRGAGNLFGFEQSGQIGRVGFNLYCKMLKEASDDRMKKKNQTHRLRPTVSFSGSAFFSDTFMPLVQDRVFYYQRLSVADSEEKIGLIEGEILDRFGKIPNEAKNVLLSALLREQMAGTRIEKVKITPTECMVLFQRPDKSTNVDFNVFHKIFVDMKKDFRLIPSKDKSLSVSITTFSTEDSFKVGSLFARLAKERIRC